MKTINDLVDKLNNYYDMECRVEKTGDGYCIEDDMSAYIYFKNSDDELYTNVSFTTYTDGKIVNTDKNKGNFTPDTLVISQSWEILSGFCMLHHEIQKDIMDFIYTTDSNHWFDEPEKKYNIIIGEDVNKNNVVHWKTAYQKCRFGAKVNDAVREEGLISDRYKFTESEIEELKSTLPENMAKIVDLGKVEVKDD